MLGECWYLLVNSDKKHSVESTYPSVDVLLKIEYVESYPSANIIPVMLFDGAAPNLAFFTVLTGCAFSESVMTEDRVPFCLACRRRSQTRILPSRPPVARTSSVCHATHLSVP
jgi:hypothetical protein